MTTWLECCERVQQYVMFIKWQQQQQHMPMSIPPQRPSNGPPQPSTHYLQMTWNLTLRRVSFGDIIYAYGAVNFQDALGNFLAHLREPNITAQTLHSCRRNILIPFHHVPIFHKIKFRNSNGTIVNAVHIQLEQVDTHGQVIPVRFNTVLVWAGQQPGNICGSQKMYWSGCYRVKILLVP